MWGTKKISQAPRCVRFSHVKPQLASRIASEESSIYIFEHQSPASHPILRQINMVSPHLSTAIKHIKSITRLSTTNQHIYPHITVSLPPSTLSIASRTSNSSITAPKLYHRVSIFQRVTTLESTYP